MIINEEMKSVIENSAFLSIVTMCTDGTPHPIITGKGVVDGDKIVFGIYKMETTQKNLKENTNAWVVACTKDGGPKGYRFTGTAEAKDKNLIFTAIKADAMI